MRSSRPADGGDRRTGHAAYAIGDAAGPDRGSAVAEVVPPGVADVAAAHEDAGRLVLPGRPDGPDRPPSVRQRACREGREQRVLLAAGEHAVERRLGPDRSGEGVDVARERLPGRGR